MVCNFCGKTLDEFDEQADLTIHSRLGYGSIHDGEEVTLHFCCSCFDVLVLNCEVSPIHGKEWYYACECNN